MARYKLLMLDHTLVKFVVPQVVLCPYDKEQMVTKLKFVIIFEYLLTIVYAIQNHLHTKNEQICLEHFFITFKELSFTGISGLHSSMQGIQAQNLTETLEFFTSTLLLATAWMRFSRVSVADVSSENLLSKTSIQVIQYLRKQYKTIL